jgi:hypothetical protein
MLYGPCRIHYAYLDGKRVPNHQMKDCKTILRLQGAMDSSQGIRQEGKSMSQGYQIQRLAKHLESKVSISAMIQPVPKLKKERKKHIQTSKPGNIITTSYYRIPAMVQSTSQVQQSRPPKESTQARACANVAKGTNRGI